MSADMTGWNSQLVERLRALLNGKEISDQTGEDDASGDTDEPPRDAVRVAAGRDGV